MINFLYDFSVIIPHKDSLHFLPKLFSTIPSSEKIQIILIDNSLVPIGRSEVKTDKHFTLLYSLPKRGAGGARNVGIEHAQGKWLVFADADDYFTDDAFEVFYNYFSSEAELIFFGMDGIYSDTGKRSDRGDSYMQLITDYLAGKRREMDIRLGFVSPCAKMVSKELVERHNIHYDEVEASNDVFFSLLTGYYAKKIDAVDKVTYIATISRGSLTKRRDYQVIKSRYLVNLRKNKFLKEHNFSKYQASIMIYLFQSRKFGYKKIIEFVKILFLYRQNPFIGISRWFNTYITERKVEKRDKKYITE